MSLVDPIPMLRAAETVPTVSAPAEEAMGQGADFAAALADLIGFAGKGAGPAAIAPATGDVPGAVDQPLPSAAAERLATLGRLTQAPATVEPGADAAQQGDVAQPWLGKVAPEGGDLAAEPDVAPTVATTDLPQATVPAQAVAEAGTVTRVVPGPHDTPVSDLQSAPQSVEAGTEDDLPEDDQPDSGPGEVAHAAPAAPVMVPQGAAVAVAGASVSVMSDPDGGASLGTTNPARGPLAKGGAKPEREAGKTTGPEERPEFAAEPRDAAPRRAADATPPADPRLYRQDPATGKDRQQPTMELTLPDSPAPTQAPVGQPAQTVSNAQVAQGQAPVALDRPGWEAAISERIAAELSDDGSQIELDLTPDNLGRLKITLEVTDGQAQVRFVTETAEAARLIQQGEARLSESLSRNGMSLGGHDAASRDAQGDRSGGRSPRGTEMSFERSAEQRPGQTGPRTGSGLVNLMA